MAQYRLGNLREQQQQLVYESLQEIKSDCKFSKSRISREIIRLKSFSTLFGDTFLDEQSSMIETINSANPTSSKIDDIMNKSFVKENNQQ